MIHQTIAVGDCRIYSSALRPLIRKMAFERQAMSVRETDGMKKPSSKIREEIGKLQEQLKQAETREAERIGRIALKAGLGEIEIDETELQDAFEHLARRFRGELAASIGGKKRVEDGIPSTATATVASGAAQGGHGEV